MKATLRPALFGHKFPVVASDTAATTSVSATPQTVGLPARITKGDLLIVYEYQGGNGRAPSSAGWTVISDTSAGTGEHAILYKVALGTEGANFSMTLGSATNASQIALRIQAGTWQGTPQIADAGTGGAVIDAPSLSVVTNWSLSPVLWLAFVGLTYSTAPTMVAGTGYSKAIQSVGNSCLASFAWKQRMWNVEDPPAFTISGGATFSKEGAKTLAIRGI